MGTAVILALALAFIGPAWLPYKMAWKGRGAVSAFCLTNLITLAPMIGISASAHYNPGPTCRRSYHDAPCDGIPFDTGWLFIDIMFVALAIWGLSTSACVTSACATSGGFRKR
jgi:hypothetical protein